MESLIVSKTTAIYRTNDEYQEDEMVTTSNIETPASADNKLSAHSGSDDSAAESAEGVRSNQARLTSELKSYSDFIVCASGSSGSEVARRLAENPDVRVLTTEASGRNPEGKSQVITADLVSL